MNNGEWYLLQNNLDPYSSRARFSNVERWTELQQITSSNIQLERPVLPKAILGASVYK
jgi:hypothetical protein